MRTTEQMIAAIGAVADRARARDGDKARRVKSARGVSDLDMKMATQRLVSGKTTLDRAVDTLNRMLSGDRSGISTHDRAEALVLKRALDRAGVRPEERGSIYGLQTRNSGFIGRSPVGTAVPPSGVREAPREQYTDAQLEKHYSRWEIVATHEAGHVVVAHALGIPVRSVSIIGGIHGCTELLHGVDDDEQAFALLYAGMLAERTDSLWNPALEGIWARTADFETIEERWATMGLSRADEKAARVHVVEMVDEILERHRDKVERVAKALMQHRTLSGKRLSDLLG